MREICFDGLSPHLRFARQVEVTRDYSYNGIVAYDARAAYVTGGEGFIEIDRRLYHLSTGGLIAWQAGQEYGFCRIGAPPINIIKLNFDYVGEPSATTLLIPDFPSRFDSGRIENYCCFLEGADENRVMYDPSALYAEPIMRELLAEYTSKHIYSEEASRGLLTLLISKLCRSIRVLHTASEAEEILAYIRAHLGERITYETLGRRFNYHPNHVGRLVAANTGVSLHRYLLKLRIERACTLLCDEGRPVGETAELCGFSDASSFSKRFRMITGMTPSEARRGRASSSH